MAGPAMTPRLLSLVFSLILLFFSVLPAEAQCPRMISQRTGNVLDASQNIRVLPAGGHLCTGAGTHMLGMTREMAWPNKNTLGCALRFDNIGLTRAEILAGSVLSAKLTLEALGEGSSPAPIRIRGAVGGIPAIYTCGQFGGRPTPYQMITGGAAVTNASILWDIPPTMSSWNYTTPDLGPILMEVVTSAGWVDGAGTLLLVFQKDGANADRSFLAQEMWLAIHVACSSTTGTTGAPPVVTTGIPSQFAGGSRCVGLSDRAGYTCRDSADGVQTSPLTSAAGLAQIALLDDGVSGNLNIPFKFLFYGTAYQQVRIGANGFITFAGQAGDRITPPLPNPAGINAVIAAFAGDLDPATNGQVSYGLLPGSFAPNRQFVVQFDSVGHYGSASRTISFEIRLHEISGIIEIHYPVVKQIHIVYHVGLEDATGQVGMTYYSNPTKSVDFPSPFSVVLYPNGTRPQKTTVGGLTTGSPTTGVPTTATTGTTAATTGIPTTTGALTSGTGSTTDAVLESSSAAAGGTPWWIFVAAAVGACCLLALGVLVVVRVRQSGAAGMPSVDYDDPRLSALPAAEYASVGDVQEKSGDSDSDVVYAELGELEGM
jgi:hypothetical protein